jgi:hypothetical protein
MKVRMAIYNLKGKARIWWQDLKLAKGLKEKQMELSTSRNISRNNTYLKATMKGKGNNFMSYDLVRWQWRIL